MSAQTLHFSPYQFLSDILHSVLPYDHPVHTAKVWMHGTPIDKSQILQMVLSLGIDKTPDYRSFVFGGESEDRREGPLENFYGWHYYDPKNKETILRVKGTRCIREPDTRLVAGGSDPISHYENDIMTFFAKGMFKPGEPSSEIKRMQEGIRYHEE